MLQSCLALFISSFLYTKHPHSRLNAHPRPHKQDKLEISCDEIKETSDALRRNKKKFNQSSNLVDLERHWIKWLSVRCEESSRCAKGGSIPHIKIESERESVINFIGMFHCRIKCIQLRNSEAEGRDADCKRGGWTTTGLNSLASTPSLLWFPWRFHITMFTTFFDLGSAQIWPLALFQRRLLRKQLQIWIYCTNNSETMLAWHFPSIWNFKWGEIGRWQDVFLFLRADCL